MGPGPSLSAPSGAKQNLDQPNIIVIFTDDQAPGTLGFEGNPHVRTPRLDRLAERGAYFSRAYVPTPQCAPSRAAFLTGLYPHQNAVVSNVEPRLKPGIITFPELFTRRGYACGLVGKWHLGQDERPQRGFEDLWVTYERPGPGYDPRLCVNGQWLEHKGYLTDILTDYALRFVQDNAERPFLLWLNYKAPHYPYVPPLDQRFAYNPGDLPLPVSMADDLSTKPSIQRDSYPHRLFVKQTPQKIRQWLSVYYAMISSVDYNVGRIVDQLRELRLDRKTLIIFMSDNGLMHGEHQMVWKGPMFYEELVRTPLIMYWPGKIKAGTRVDSLVSSLDLLPTMCSMAGIDPPPNLEGRDLTALLSGKPTRPREALFLEYDRMKTVGQRMPMRGLVTRRYKYVRYLEGGEEELYDLQSDPREMRNLIREEEYRELADSLRQKLLAWRAASGDAD